MTQCQRREVQQRLIQFRYARNTCIFVIYEVFEIIDLSKNIRTVCSEIRANLTSNSRQSLHH